MNIIKLDATDSTNAYLKDLGQREPLPDFTAVVAREQTSGRGQMGSSWSSEAGKNLTFSVLKKLNGVPVHHQFALSAAVSLGLYDALGTLGVPHLSVKWPNDILSGTSKICGILIENILSGKRLQASVIGIGLNVNQTDFAPLENVSSLKSLLHRTLGLDDVLKTILESLRRSIALVEEEKIGQLYGRYEEKLFRKGRASRFLDAEENPFEATIQGVDGQGRLLLAHTGGPTVSYGLKEVKLLY